jgi:hypothetical protein
MDSGNSLSVLRRAQASDVVANPYPFVVVHDALPNDLCDALIADYPRLDILGVDATQNNSRWSIPALDASQNPLIAGVWKEFVAYHASPAFFDECVRVFGEHVVRLYPRVFPDLDTLRSLRLGIRDRDPIDDCDFFLDAQISGNTPVVEASSVKSIHVDSEHKLFSGLLYLRTPGDDSIGGDLDVLRLRRDLTEGQRSRRFDGMFIEDDLVEQVVRVPYRRNTLFMFVNGSDSLHGVTVRQPTPHPRLFMNLVGESRVKLFDVPQHWQKRVAKLPRLIKKRLRRAVGAD